MYTHEKGCTCTGAHENGFVLILIFPDFERKALVLTNFVLRAHDKRHVLILVLTTRETCTHTHNIVLILITLLPQEPTSR